VENLYTPDIGCSCTVILLCLLVNLFLSSETTCIHWQRIMANCCGYVNGIFSSVLREVSFAGDFQGFLGTFSL